MSQKNCDLQLKGLLGAAFKWTTQQITFLNKFYIAFKMHNFTFSHPKVFYSVLFRILQLSREIQQYQRVIEIEFIDFK